MQQRNVELQAEVERFKYRHTGETSNAPGTSTSPPTVGSMPPASPNVSTPESTIQNPALTPPLEQVDEQTECSVDRTNRQLMQDIDQLQQSLRVKEEGFLSKEK